MKGSSLNLEDTIMKINELNTRKAQSIKQAFLEMMREMFRNSSTVITVFSTLNTSVLDRTFRYWSKKTWVKL